jgi:hypothetical protein
VGDEDVDVPGIKFFDSSFSEELSKAEINIWIHKVLHHGANLSPRASPTPLREGVANARVSLLGSILAIYLILSSHSACNFMQGLRGAHIVSRVSACWCFSHHPGTGWSRSCIPISRLSCEL